MAVEGRLKLRRAGGSVIATIPRELIDEAGLKPGDEVFAVIRKRKELIDELVGCLADLEPFDFDRDELWGLDRY